MTTFKKGFAFSLISASLIACSSSSSVAPESVETDSYAGPGSKWDVELNSDDSFSITRRDTPLTPITMTVEGEYNRHSSGFMSLTVGSASGTDAPDPGDQAWALEVPGYALLLKPMTSDKIIAMVTSGECPTADIDANWIVVKQADGTDATDNSRDYFGSFHYDLATDTPSLPSKYAVSTGFPAVVGGSGLGTGSCENGLMYVGTSPDIAAMYLTRTGGAIVQTNINDESDSQFIFALAQKAIGDIGSLQGDYAGMLFDDNTVSGDSVSPVSMSCDNVGVCTGTLVTDVTTGALDTDTVTLALTNAVDDLEDGFVTGTITAGSDTGNLSCMVDLDANNSGKTIVNCIGQSPGDNTKMFNVMFVSR